MENILTQIDALTAELGKLKNFVSKVLREISEKKKELNSITAAQDNKTKELDAREKEIKKIEDIVKLREDTQKLVNQTEIATKELLNNQRIFKESIVKQNKEIADRKVENENARVRNERETAALIKLRKELEEETANYKLKIAQGLVKIADKN